MPVSSRRRLRKQLHQVLEKWISEELGDSSEEEDIHVRHRLWNPAMDARSHDRPGTSSSEERASSKMSMSSTATDHLPPPPKYESVIQRPVMDYSGDKKTKWEREINEIVGDFDKTCTAREAPTTKRVSSGAHSYSRESSSVTSAAPATSSALGRDFDWDSDLLSGDTFFRDSPMRQRLFADRPFGSMRSRFGEDIDRFFGRGTFSTGWDTFFPEITFSDFPSRSGVRDRAISNDVQAATGDEDYKVEVDVQGFEPHELLVKTVGHNLLVLAKTEASNGEDTGIGKNKEFRELRREFTIPPHVDPTEISSNLTPDGILVIEAPAGKTIALQSRDD